MDRFFCRCSPRRQHAGPLSAHVHMAGAVAADYDAVVREPCMQDWEVMDIEHYHACRRPGVLTEWESPEKIF